MLTRADVIRLARKAGFEVGRDAGGEYVAPQYSDSVGTLVRFAALVAADERDECANLCDKFAELMRSGKSGDQLTDQLLDLQAKIGDDLAATIRAREKGGE